MTPRSYWLHDRHGHDNEHIVGVSLDGAGVAAFQEAGYRPVNKLEALAAARYDGMTTATVGYRIGTPDNATDKRTWLQSVHQ